MAGEATASTSAAILKTKYTQPKVYWLSYANNPGFGTVRKDETFGGDNKVVAVQTEVPLGAGPTVAIAQDNLGPGSYSKFIVTRISDYAVARVTGEAMKAADGNDNALLNLWKREMDGAIHANKRSASIHLWRDGFGARGQISSSSNVNTNTITLATTTDITNFAVGQKVQFSSANGGSLRNTGANATISAISRTSGTLTFSAALDTFVAAVAANDYVYRNGDGANGSSRLMVSGVQAWVPAATPNNTAFFGLDRSTDEVRLGGCRSNASGVPMSEALVEMIAIAQVEGAEVDMAWMHPRDRATLVKELGARVSYTRVESKIKGSDAKIGFDTIQVDFDGTTVKLMSDLNVPRGKCFVTQWNTWAFESLGPGPHILDYDSNDFLRVSTADTYEVRVGYYANVTNLAPAFTVHGSNFGA